MTNYVCRFPDGAAGLGLLLLRTCYAPAAFAIAAPLSMVDAYLRYPIAALVALCLVLGLATRPAALVLGVGAVVALSTSDLFEQGLLLGQVGGSAGIALLGAGAFSIDARLHGRRVIHLQSSNPDRGADD